MANAGCSGVDFASLNGDGVSVAPERAHKALHAHVRPHVRMNGLSTTHPRVIAKDISSLERCRTLSSALSLMEELRERWSSLGLFRQVQYTLEPTQDGAPEDVCIDVTVEEARPRKSVGVYTTETSVPEISFSLDNVFGGRYSFKGNYIPPASRVHAVSASFVSNVPLIGQQAEYYIGRRAESKIFHVADMERIDEVKATTRNHSHGFASELSVGVQRRALVSSEAASLPDEMMLDFAPSDKNFVRHELTLDNVAYHQHPALFNMYPLPVAGYQLNVRHEVAGGVMGGDVSFVKSELQGSIFRPLGPFFSLQWSTRVAGIASFMGRRVPLSDRIFLSNSHVRGFKSIGPSLVRADGCDARFAATGGNALWATSLSINFPFLFYPANGVAAMHVFINAGNLRMVKSLVAICDAHAWLRTCACSVGAGIVVTRIPLLGISPSGRFELNMSLPLGVDGHGNIVTRNGDGALFDRFRFGLVWSSDYAI